MWRCFEEACLNNYGLTLNFKKTSGSTLIEAYQTARAWYRFYNLVYYLFNCIISIIMTRMWFWSPLVYTGLKISQSPGLEDCISVCVCNQQRQGPHQRGNDFTRLWGPRGRAGMCANLHTHTHTQSPACHLPGRVLSVLFILASLGES